MSPGASKQLAHPRCRRPVQEERTVLKERGRDDHLVQRRPFHQLKWRGVNAYLLHVNRFIQLLLVPDFNLNQPPKKSQRYRVSTHFLNQKAQSRGCPTSSGVMVSVS